jgi:hypothetical protein
MARTDAFGYIEAGQRRYKLLDPTGGVGIGGV